MIQDELRLIGMNENQIKVYLALLSLGSSPASIISKRVNMPRSTVRFTCKQLQQEGIITMMTKNNVQIFSAKAPDALSQWLEHKSYELKQQKQRLQGVMQQLQGMYRPDQNPTQVTYYEGAAGVIEMLEDVLKENETMCTALCLQEDFDQEVMDYFRNRYIPARAKLQNKARSLFSDNAANRAYQKQDEMMNRVSLLIPEAEFPFRHYFHIYGDKLAFFAQEAGRVNGVVIQDKNMVETQMSLFKMAWRYARGLKLNQNQPKTELDS